MRQVGYLKADDVAAKVLEPVREDPRPNHGLQARESQTHLKVALALDVAPPLPLDDDGGAAQAQKATSVNPAAYAALDDDQFLGQHAIPLLFQKQILRVLEEDFGLAQLVVGILQYDRANPGRCLPAIHLQPHGQCK